MNVLILGSGGREHALVKALLQSPDVIQIHVIPGNDGIQMHALCHQINLQNPEELQTFVKQKQINLVVVGPEQPLCDGISDILKINNIPVFGPNKAAAQLEGSKIFAKNFMNKHKIPTAKSVTVKSVQNIEESMDQFQAPYVLKADGLAAGKGVAICNTKEELLVQADNYFNKNIFGEAGTTALLEQHLEGYELSCLVLTNGQRFQILPFIQDHKRLLDEDLGPNTGGMGTAGPVNIHSSLKDDIAQKIVIPTLEGIQNQSDFEYNGVLFIGLMVTEQGPKVIEYNVRFGDPELQCILPLLNGDWAEVFKSIASGDCPTLKWKPLYSACVVLAAEGYPENPVKGVPIEGDITHETPSSYFLYAGIKKDQDNKFYTNGGRVINSVGIGDSLQQAIENAYKQAQYIQWKNYQFRKDIGKKLLSPSKG
ncbi:MAG: phosphoribosylamine--glycine ligase [Bdellovibrionales bacterium]|nr:phosphoribosylamine--glycine ligase [Bdellovibrionales bacterium]